MIDLLDFMGDVLIYIRQVLLSDRDALSKPTGPETDSVGLLG
jgi:hypothetical protein